MVYSYASLKKTAKSSVDCFDGCRFLQYGDLPFFARVLVSFDLDSPMPVSRNRMFPPPENVPLAMTATAKHLYFEHAFAFAAACIFVVSLLTTATSFSDAQEFRAAVSAAVLPLESYCPACVVNTDHPLLRWWKSLDTYHRVLYGSGTALAGLVIPLGALVVIRERHTAHLVISPSRVR